MSLHDLLKRRIATLGPIMVAEYMSDCLMHPDYGYYATKDPLGAAGDFTTAPEISQMFGELIGLALAQTWLDQGKPARVVLAELGPGRGTLMADALRALRGVPGFLDAAEVQFVETSPALRAKQAKAVPGARFHDNIDTLPSGPLYLIANEFFDALPIRQFERAETGWRERMVGYDDGFTFGLSQVAPFIPLNGRLDETKPGDIVEVCPALPGMIDVLSTRIETDGGVGLIIDYGDWASLGDTLQALEGHKTVDPLANPGSADLTAHVDFAAIAQAAKCKHTRLTPQGVFLERLGITARAQSLAARLKGKALESHISAHRRLTHPDEMGNLFKVIGLYPSNAAPPPGLQS